MSVNLHHVRAEEVMNRRPEWALAGENLLVAGRRMAAAGIRALLVAGAEPEDLPGIVTQKDVVNLLGSESAAVLDTLQVHDVMTRPAICVPAQANLHDCINLMRMSGVRRLPVLDGTRVVGVLSTSDIFARVLREP